jgi:hypothetical protein
MQRAQTGRLISQHPTAGKVHDLDGAVTMCGPVGTFLPARTGPRPVTTPGLPHAQLDQQPQDGHPRGAGAAGVRPAPGR